jgi:hypothetical protein
MAAWTFAAMVWITSLFKAAAWSGVALVGARDRRLKARHNVKAYLHVLGWNNGQSKA